MGYEDKIVVSHDGHGHIDWMPLEEFQYLKANTMPDWRFYHFPKDVIPVLLEKGVKHNQIRQMMVENPRRIFEISNSR